MPELRAPFPSEINRHADAVHEGTVAWLERFGAFPGEKDYRRFYATRIGRLAARFHPDAPPEVLQLVSDWYGWMFYWDDRRDESELGGRPGLLADVNERLLGIIRGKEPEEEGALAHALWDLRGRVIAEAPTEAWMRRFVDSVEEHFRSTVWEAENRASGTVPDVETYVRMRPVTGGLNVDTRFVEMAERARTDEVWWHPAVRRLVEASNNAVCWANDVFSLDKELRRGDVHNLVLVLRHARGLELREAIERVVEMHNAEVRAFAEAASLLAGDGRRIEPDLERFVDVLRARMRGFLDWAEESGRYRTSVRIAPPPEVSR